VVLDDDSEGESMALPRSIVMDGLASSMADFEVLLRSLDQGAWDKASRCDGWTVGDVAKHAVGSIADAVSGRTEGLGSDEVTQREVDERQGKGPTDMADECREVAAAAAQLIPLFDDEAWAAPAPGGYHGTLGDGIEALWADFWFHADDIRHAIGLESVIDAGLPGALSHVCFELQHRGWDGDVPEEKADQIPWLLSATGRAPLRDGLINIYA
jgi:uncharacterized protein (TIGR03083 family)